MQVSVADIERKSVEALIAHGAAAWQARAVARAVARAEQTGNVICGLYYLESYCVQLASGRVNGTVEPLVKTLRPGTINVDAGLGFAQPAFERGLPTTIEAAKNCLMYFPHGQFLPGQEHLTQVSVKFQLQICFELASRLGSSFA